VPAIERRREYPFLKVTAPYSPAVRVGDWLYVAGIVSGRTPDAVEQTRDIMETLKKVMEAEGGTLDDVVRIDVYMTEFDRWRESSEVRRQYFKGSPPASTLVQIVALAAPQFKIEIEAIAYLGSLVGISGGSHMPKTIGHYPHLPPPAGLYSYGVKAGGWLHLAGATARGTSAENGDIVAQTEAVLEKIKGILEAEGGSLKDVVKTVVYVTELDRYRETADVRRRYFGEDLPTSTLIQVVALADPNFKIEIEATAYIGN
jgi:enamine deaminase RidA (YjgF/YER057c/UK114 family)